MTRSTYVKAAVLVAVLVAAVVVQLWVGLPDKEELRVLLDGLGAVAIPAFIGLYIVSSLLPVGPSAILTIVGGALLGFVVALASVLTAAVIAAALAFLISRFLGREAVQGLSGARVRELDERVRDHGFATVLVARLLPVIPFTTANYAFGLTAVRFGSYVAGTAIGIVPGTALYVAVGAFGAEPGSWPFLLAVAGLVLLSVIGLVRSRRHRGSDVSGPTTGAGPSPTPT